MIELYLLLAALMTGMALVGLFRTTDLLRRVLALNVLGSAVFLLLVTLARTAEGIDPLPHAMVLTGIVVAVSTTAAVLALTVQAHERGRRGEGP
ncbi:NADH-quinone oxidoreductase subunit K [Halomonas sp. TRM85114]|uniref:NADH-quinone oxidoreductase subunit K n=1 Tax=Halomonas jincaotanensis TaxID=2810616 RepID=UPI001BD4242F|nr:NADH-quinone oxidoreductase subunit K [Halomonas jincaotanensis]MBS9404096.1 NADH-quinone oxidoreductase subunit K [Halomonas jincaotanensis]